MAKVVAEAVNIKRSKRLVIKQLIPTQMVKKIQTINVIIMTNVIIEFVILRIAEKKSNSTDGTQL